MIYFHWTLLERGSRFPPLMGNNSCKTHNFRIKIGQMLMVYLIIDSTVLSYNLVNILIKMDTLVKPRS
jgi:hypothetical protein